MPCTNGTTRWTPGYKVPGATPEIWLTSTSAMPLGTIVIDAPASSVEGTHAWPTSATPGSRTPHAAVRAEPHPTHRLPDGDPPRSFIRLRCPHMRCKPGAGTDAATG